MSKILITGGFGFIGLHLAKRLSKNSDNRIVIVDDSSRGKPDKETQELLELPNVEVINLDLSSSTECQTIPVDFNYIYHLAAVIGVKNVMEKPDRVLAVNSSSVINILDLARKCKSLKRILFSSTSEIYAGTLKHFGVSVPTPEDVHIAIDSVESPRSTYAISKLFGESAFHSYGRVYDIPFTIVRYHNIYGPRMGFAHVIPEMIRKISKADKISVASADHTRSFCYVDDAVEYTIRSCELENTRGETLNIGSGVSEIEIRALVNQIGQEMGKSIETEETSATPGSPARRCPDTSKLIAQTGWRPQVDLKTGLKRTYDWYQDRI